MSFGYDDEQLVIGKAIRKALYERDDGIIFFAAASNNGANYREMYPARDDSVISIRGTNANGDFEDFNPPRTQRGNIAFGTLGVDVPAAWLSHQDGDVYLTGTSFATAVAAGIAGVLMGYVSRKSGESEYEGICKKIRRRQGMVAMFNDLSSPTLKELCYYLAPWDLIGRSDEVRWARFVAALSKI